MVLIDSGDSGRTGTLAVEQPGENLVENPGELSLGPAETGARSRQGSRNRQHHAPVTVEVTVQWWHTDGGRSTYANNQFGATPATPVRFRCVGTLGAKYPQRYKVDLARALDWLPCLSRNELKELGVTMAKLITNKLGLDVAPISVDVIDPDPAGDDS